MDSLVALDLEKLKEKELNNVYKFICEIKHEQAFALINNIISSINYKNINKGNTEKLFIMFRKNPDLSYIIKKSYEIANQIKK
jgi:hypothetical protein